MADAEALRQQQRMQRMAARRKYQQDLQVAKEASQVMSNPQLKDLHPRELNRLTNVFKDYNVLPQNANPNMQDWSENRLNSAMGEMESLITHFEEGGDPKQFKYGLQNWLHRQGTDKGEE